MDHSLINPNQIRHFGIPVSNNPYDTEKALGIDHQTIFLPFKTQGSTVYFDSTVPTDDDLESCPHIVLTDGEREWEPNEVEMSGNRPCGDNVTSTVQAARRVCKQRTMAPVEYESDLVLGSISNSFVIESAYECLVSSVWVTYPSKKQIEKKHWKKRNVAQANKAISNSQHSRITPEHLARMLNIGLDKVKQMLKVTTQKGVWTAVHPIHRCYWVDHLDLHSNCLA